MVVLLVSVLVMHNLFGFQGAADRLLDHQNVLPHVAVGVGAFVVRPEHQAVSVLDDECSSPRKGVARTGTKTRPIISARPDFDRAFAAGAARRGSFCAAVTRAEGYVPSGRGRSTAWFTAAVAWNLGQFVSRPLLEPASVECRARACWCRRTSATSDIAGSTAVNAAELESTGREINLSAACRARSFHIGIIARWQKKDMGHFEYVAPHAETTRRA